MGKQSEELKNVIKAIEIYIKKYKGDACFNASFCGFDKKGEVIDDIVLAYGVKDCIKIQLKQSLEMLKKEKDNFINW